MGDTAGDDGGTGEEELGRTPMGQTREPRLASKDRGKLFVDLACKQPRLY